MAKERRVANLKRLNRCLLLVVALVLLSCGGYSLHNYQSVGGSWARGHSLAFVQDLSSQAGADSLNLFVGVRYSASYEYKNLWLQVDTYAGDDSLMLRDTLCCAIYDDKGRRNGSTAGTLYQAEFYVAPVPHNCIHTIRLQHIMQDTLLRGVYDVGVKLAPRGLHQCAER